MRVTHRQLRKLVRGSIRRTLRGNSHNLHEGALGTMLSTAVTLTDEYSKMSKKEKDSPDGKALRDKLEAARDEFEGFEITNRKAKRAVAGQITKALEGGDVDMNQLEKGSKDLKDEDGSASPKGDVRWSKYGWTYVFTPDGGVYTTRGDDSQKPVGEMTKIGLGMTTKARDDRKIPPGSNMYSVIVRQGYRRGLDQMGLDKGSFKKAFPKQYAEKKKLDAAWEAHEGGGSKGSPAGSPTPRESQAFRGSLLESRRRAAQQNQRRFIMNYVKKNF
tara:strand:- start:22969 stop:23790 length:822 start_codon:yes stop_codon:yes gene_type:complete